MNIKKKLILLIISTLWLFFGQSCTQKKATPLSNLHAAVLIDSDFTSQSINERVLVSTKLSEKDLSRKNIKKWISENTEKVSQKKEAILIGNFRKYPQAWFYTQIINTTNVNQVLVADEFNRLRCDAFELYTIEDDGIKKRGSLNRSTPFSKYPLPFFTYALPFTIQPKDTLNLLIHTQRHFGVHEVNLNVYNYENYINTTFTVFLTKIFQSVVFLFLFFIMIILGQIFKVRSMTYWGVYILSLLLVFITTWGFTDTISNFSQIGLSGSNVSVFMMMIICFTPHLFLLEWMKAVPKNEKAFKGISYFLFGISFLCTTCYLFPKSLFNLIQTNISLTLVMVILIFVNLTWLFYCSVLAWVRIKIYYLTLGLIVAYTPFILGQTRLLSSKYYVILKSDYIIISSVTIGLAIVGIYLLREQLITRKNLNKNLTQLKEAMEDIRKTEVETIGRNLHDNVGNILASAVGYLNLKKPNTDTSEYLIKEAIQEIRFLSHNLVKDEDIPLLQKLESLVSRFNDFSEIQFVFENFSEHQINQLDKITQQNIYMIIQEVLTNVIKHSKATEAFIQVFEREDKILQFTIEDDGIGINNITENAGIGLKNIYKRANMSNLKLTVDSTPTGTIFILETPKAL
jgi:signal transduction histidine kinase